eukprot:TRINITY_DN4334_c0_g1_i1.p1 TRINITY_DN4334_c0_g1~~TRINITY_DN4334_c0_g1_i1.p1  ORF type:complete len:353 (-),score=52.00 TRINITY_DN4334_c0_g1_i1:220-1278(-)
MSSSTTSRESGGIGAGKIDFAVDPSASVKGYNDEPMYSGVCSFMRRKYTRDLDDSSASQENKIDVVVTGVPFDLATTHRPGARFGPQSIRRACANLCWEACRYPWSFCVFEELGVVDYGDLFFKPGEPQTMMDALEEHTDRILKIGKTMLTLGGDHFITLPLVRSHARAHGIVGASGELAVALIHFDAHTDTYEEGSQYDHGTMFHTAVNEGVILTKNSVQVGIRTEYTKEGHPFKVLDAAYVNEVGPRKTSERIREIVGESVPCYLTFDIDCLDPAFAPGTGTPVCGGLSTDYCLRILRGLVGLNIVGMDVVEVAPAYDHADITSLAGATIALEMLYLIAATRMQKEEQAR